LKFVQQALFSLDPAPIEFSLAFTIRAGEKEPVVFDDFLAAAGGHAAKVAHGSPARLKAAWRPCESENAIGKVPAASVSSELCSSARRLSMNRRFNSESLVRSNRR
jgi:hypothetical protein